MNHLSKFKSCCQNDNFISIELEPINVNKVLREHYTCPFPFTMTKSQLWDMEIKKAARPDLFIPFVIKNGSAVSWGKVTVNDIDTFIRVSEQRLWLDAEQYGTIIENVHVNHLAQVVTFIGESKTKSNEYGEFVTSNNQAIFHVQHGVIGEEGNPLNTWKIVHLTSENEQELNVRFQKMNDYKWLPEYIEIYIRDILGIDLQRKS